MNDGAVVDGVGLLCTLSARDIELSLPEFVYASSNPNTTALSIESTGSTSSNLGHLNYYNLNHEGRQAVKRILCVFEYQYPQVTYSPGIVSIASLLAHYMQEQEVYRALCFMSSTKEHLIECKSSWDITSSVFVRLLKNYCVRPQPSPPIKTVQLLACNRTVL